jgi:hypothetical protein
MGNMMMMSATLSGYRTNSLKDLDQHHSWCSIAKLQPILTLLGAYSAGEPVATTMTRHHHHHHVTH